LGCSSTVSLFDASGLRLPVAPKFTSTLQMRYEVPTKGNVRPFIQGDWYHRSSINYVVNQAPGAGLDAIDIVGASLGARIDERLRVSVFCKNCTNRINPSAIGIDSGDANARSPRGAPTPKLSYAQQFGLDSVRTIGINLGFDF
jgi:iron complex outermembrane receptor protein